MSNIRHYKQAEWRKGLEPTVYEYRQNKRLSRKETARRMGISTSTVYRIEADFNHPKVEAPKPRKYDFEEFATLVAEGLTAKELASKLGVSTTRIYVVAKERGLKITPDPKANNKPSPEALARALRFLEDHTGYEEASRSTDLAVDTLKKHFPGYGLDQAESSGFYQQIKAIVRSAKANNVNLDELARLTVKN